MASGMDQLGTNINASGATMSRDEVERERGKKGQCLTCGQQCFEKKMFSKVPLTIPGAVLNGRCLTCKPLNIPSGGAVLPAQVVAASAGDVQNYRQESSRRLMHHRGESSRSVNTNGSCGNAGGGNPSAYSAAIGLSAAERLRDKHRDRHGRKPRSASRLEMEDRDSRRHLEDRNSRRRMPMEERQGSVSANSSGGYIKNSRRTVAQSTITDGDAETQQQSQRAPGRLGSNRGLSDRSLNSCSSAAAQPEKKKPSSRSLDEIREEAQQVLQDMDSTDYISIFCVMKNHPDSIDIQTATCKALANLELVEDDRLGAADMGGIETLISSMKLHKDDATIQELGCRSLWNLSEKNDNQDVIADQGGIDAITSAMTTHENDAHVQEKAIAALSNLAATESNQNLILANKGIQHLVKAMNVHMTEAAVQEMGAVAITNLASRSPHLKAAIAKENGINAIVVMMMVHHYNPELTAKALRAIRNMCANDDGNKKLVAEIGGIEYVIRAMQDHRDHVGVQEQGCWTLSNIAVNAENKVVIGNLGGVDVIVRAMWVHMDSASVLEWACRALWTLSVDQGNKTKVIEVGGIDAVVSGMRAHQIVPAVQEKGCGVLANLAANSDENKVKIVEQEGLDVIIMAMMLHPDSRLVQDRACSALRKLVCEENLPTMKTSGVAQVLANARDKFPEKCADKANSILGLIDG